MINKKLENIVSIISNDLSTSMSDVKLIISKFIEIIDKNTEYYKKPVSPIRFGVLSLDAYYELHPGVIIISGHESSGKTSLGKTIVASALRQQLYTLYHDTENKLFLNDLSALKNSLFANNIEGIQLEYWIKTKLLDMVLIDTVTTLNYNTSNYLIDKMRPYIDFIILLTQMRVDIKTQKNIPACNPIHISNSHTRILFTNIEKIQVGSLDMKRVHYIMSKYTANIKLERSRGSFIIRNNMIDNLYTAIDILRTRGRISSRGPLKYLDDELLGNYNKFTNDPEICNRLIIEAWSELTDKDIGDSELYGMFEVQNFTEKDRRIDLT